MRFCLQVRARQGDLTPRLYTGRTSSRYPKTPEICADLRLCARFRTPISTIVTIFDLSAAISVASAGMLERRNEAPMPRKPQPTLLHSTRPNCPVCGSVSYSSSGVHPQCAMQQADAERMKRLKARPKAATKASAEESISPWQKVCPRCKSVVHIRKKICTCGCKLGVTVRR